jgi:thiol-disulfide isomerase/thioredoxin
MHRLNRRSTAVSCLAVTAVALLLSFEAGCGRADKQAVADRGTLDRDSARVEDSATVREGTVEHDGAQEHDAPSVGVVSNGPASEKVSSEESARTVSLDQPESQTTPPSDSSKSPPADSPPDVQTPPDDQIAHCGDAGTDFPFPRRFPLPPDALAGGVDWINTGGPLDLKALKGKFVLLDFWTYCCINCMHILPELKKLESQYPNQLVVIGVHSAKFETEEDTKNITDAVMRYEIAHPVVNDARHTIWNRFGVESWPTAILIDPEGNAVYGTRGEFKADVFGSVIKSALAYYRKKGTLDETPLRFDLAAYRSRPTPLRFPGKVLADEATDRLFISDSSHNRIVATRLDGTLVVTIGAGSVGAADGDFDSATFNHPQGMALAGETLYVADTENHLLRKVDLASKKVATIAGLDPRKAGNRGAVAMLRRWSVGQPRKIEISSPWALWIHDKNLYIAMAGPHQIWKMPLDESKIGPYAGNGREDIVDGPLLPREPYEEGFASFAQPSGLTSDGKWLYVADSEGSSIRAVPYDHTKQVLTVVGTSRLPFGRLFTFGDADGEGDNVRLQHCLGVAWYDGQLYVADTYNNKIKVVDPTKASSRTIAGTGRPGHDDAPATFDEPAGISAAGGKLYVADTNNHLVRVIDLKNNNAVTTLAIKGLEPPKLSRPDGEAGPAGTADDESGKQIDVPRTTIKAAGGKLRLAFNLVLPAGYKINPLAPMRYRVQAVGDAGPIDRSVIGAVSIGKPGAGKFVKLDKPARQFEITVPVKSKTGEDRLRASLDYFYCQEGSEGVCKAGRATWNVPVKLADDATQTVVPLELKVE